MTAARAVRPDAAPHPPLDRLTVHALITGVSFLAYIVARLADGAPAQIAGAIGVSACGWMWLLARALFDPAPRDGLWPRALVGVLAVAGAIAVFAPDGGLASGVAENLYVLTGSAALLLTVSEPLQARGCALSATERRFRLIFLLAFTLLVGVAVLGVWLDPEPVRLVCALAGLAGAGAAVAYRRHAPLKAAEPAPKARPPATDDDVRLASRIHRLLTEDGLDAEPNLRIGDIAARLGVPEHRVSRAVSAGLGFRNFNRLVNHHRIARARRMLDAGDAKRSILEVALDCGFASLGPFNRAFKAETGMTPRAYLRRHSAA